MSNKKHYSKKNGTVLTRRWIPEDYYKVVHDFSLKLDIPTTEGYYLREKVLRNDFQVTKKVRKRGSGRTVFEIDFGDVKL